VHWPAHTPFGALQPSSVLLEFTTWFVWLAVFAVIQMKVCRRYPGIQTMCRVVFFATLVVALLPGVWVLTLKLSAGPRLIALLNRAFGMGVFAQTFLRALFLTNWMAFSEPHQSLAFASQTSLPGGHTERDLVVMLLALTQALHRINPHKPGQT